MWQDIELSSETAMWLNIIGATMAVLAVTVTAWALWSSRRHARQRAAVAENNLPSEILKLSPNAVRLVSLALDRFPVWPWEKPLLNHIKQEVAQLKSS